MVNKKVAGRMQWHLYELMARHRIRTAVDLQKMLADVGVQVTRSHLAKLVINNPRRLSSELMYGLTEVFGCTTDELWSNPNSTQLSTRMTPVTEPTTGRSSSNVERISQNSTPDKATSSLHLDDVGPPARPFKNPAEKK